MKRRAAAQIARAQFQPGLLGLLVNPFYFARQGLHEHLGALASAVRGRVLDVGCGQKPYRHLFDVDEYVYIDTAHVTRNGNEIIARRMLERIESDGLRMAAADR